MTTKRNNPIFSTLNTLNALIVGLVISLNACTAEVPADQQIVNLPALDETHPSLFQLMTKRDDTSAVSNHLSIARVDLANQRVEIMNASEEPLNVPLLRVWSRDDENSFSGTVEPYGVVEIPLTLAADADFVLMAVNEQAIRYLEYGGIFLDVPYREDLWEGGAAAAPANGGHIDATRPARRTEKDNAAAFEVSPANAGDSVGTASPSTLSPSQVYDSELAPQKPHAWGEPSTNPVPCNGSAQGPICGVNRGQ